jgi:lipocalin
MRASFVKLFCVSRKLVVTQHFQIKFVASNNAQYLFIYSRNYVLFGVISSNFVTSNAWMAASSDFERMQKKAFVA